MIADQNRGRRGLTPPPRSLVLILTVIAVMLFAPAMAWAQTSGSFGDAVNRGPLYAAGAALLGGFLVSLTPCVYPMVAITVSVFGARETETRLQGLGLSSAFVLGIIAMFTPLGVVAGLTGSLFGSVLQNPWVIVGIAVLFLAMAASMFGAFEVALPSSLTNRLAEVGGIGPKGAFGLGLVCGLIAAPCTGPVLTGILTWIAQTQSATAGALAMLAFSLGLGAPFLIVGTFAVQLPKSGRWMVHVKSFLAIVLATVAFYYLDTAFPSLGEWIKPTPVFYAVAGATLTLGLAAGAIHRDFGSPRAKDKILKGLGAALSVFGSFVLVVALTTPARSLKWIHVPYEAAQQTARAEKRPMLVDFTATWCGACKELDKLTFADPNVNSEAGRFVAVKIDASDDEDPEVRKVMGRLGVVGLPTVVVFDSSGNEAVRFTDFVGAEEFLLAIQKVE